MLSRSRSEVQGRVEAESNKASCRWPHRTERILHNLEYNRHPHQVSWTYKLFRDFRRVHSSDRRLRQ